jgi:pimeloyl-ACP methyl ester carboxylesterase
MQHWKFWALALLFLGGCSSLPGVTTGAVDGREVEYLVSRQGSPVLVFENGLGGRLQWWSKVWPEVARDSSALAYNRAGYGDSSAVAGPRDGAHIVQELRQLLKAQDLLPPYVLVGHSLGGLYMQLYARQYPTEVAALVLVDATHPEQLKGAGNPQAWPAWLKASFGVLASDVAKRELADLDATGQAVLRLPVEPGIAVWVLSALRPMQASSPLADDANRKRADLANLYPGARQVWVDSEHGIPLEKPEAVVDAIREALRLARARH